MKTIAELKVMKRNGEELTEREEQKLEKHLKRQVNKAEKNKENYLFFNFTAKKTPENSEMKRLFDERAKGSGMPKGQFFLKAMQEILTQQGNQSANYGLELLKSKLGSSKNLDEIAPKKWFSKDRKLNQKKVENLFSFCLQPSPYKDEMMANLLRNAVSKIKEKLGVEIEGLDELTKESQSEEAIGGAK